MTTATATATVRSIRCITEEQLSRLFELREERLTLQREADAIKKSEDRIRGEVCGILIDNDRDQVRRGEFQAILKDGRPAVSWKDEFLKLAERFGLDGEELAGEILDDAPRRQTVDVKKLKA